MELSSCGVVDLDICDVMYLRSCGVVEWLSG